MKFISIDRKFQFAWLWKFLVNWSDGYVSISYYSDYENRDYGMELVFRRSGFSLTIDWT